MTVCARITQFLFDWQTLTGGILALFAGVGAVWATVTAANRQVTAARDAADRQIKSAEKQLRDARESREQEQAQRKHAIVWALRLEAARIKHAAEERRRTLPGPEMAGALQWVQLRKDNLKITGFVRERGSIGLLDIETQDLLNELGQSVDAYNTYIDVCPMNDTEGVYITPPAKDLLTDVIMRADNLATAVFEAD